RCAEPPQGFGALVLTPNQGAHLVPPCEQEFGEVAADATHSAGCSGHEDRAVVFMFRCHVADLGLRSKDELATTRTPVTTPLPGRQCFKPASPAPGSRASVT